MEYNYKYGQKITAAMKSGKTIHEELESEINVPIILQPKSYPDALYKIVYTSVEALKALKEKKKTREVQVYGSIGGYTVVGKIDKLEIRDNRIVISEDKTRANGQIPSESQQLIHKIQLIMYKKMLDDLKWGYYGFGNFEVAYHINTLKLSEEFKRQLDALKIDSSRQSIPSIAKEFFSELRLMQDISNVMEVKYIDQFTGNEIKSHRVEYDKAETDQIIKFVLKYWNGERQALPVPENESWKCRFCVFFGKECTTWWKQKEL